MSNVRQIAEYFCPHCGANLRGEPIPEASQHFYGASHFGREIGVEVWAVYDGQLYFRCPDCGGKWHRWPKGTWQHEKAIPYIERREDETH